MKYYRPLQDYSIDQEIERPRLHIPLIPPDWYLEKIEKEKNAEKRPVVSEIDYTIRDSKNIIIIDM